MKKFFFWGLSTLSIEGTCGLSIAGIATGRSPIEIMYDSSQALHRCIDYHPEQPDRINICVERLKKYQESHPESKSNFNVMDVSPRKTDHDHDFALRDDELKQAREALIQIHSEEYVTRFESKCHASRQQRIEEGKGPLGFIGYVDPDTYLTTESYDVFLHATAIWIRAVENVMLQRSTFILNGSNDVKDAPLFGIPSSMALTRPPGHHATQKLANGFCVFNFAAAAAKHAINKGIAKRVSILDWDVHFGQGVADIVKNDPNIRYVSLHQCPAFPYMGEELSFDGEHRNIFTVPIQAGMTWETGYHDVFLNKALPFILTTKDDANDDYQEWVPDLVIVCAGYDALASDQLASVNLNPIDYGQMTKYIQNRIMEANVPCGLVLGLEGGYQLQDEEKGLGAAVLESVKALSGSI